MDESKKTEELVFLVFYFEFIQVVGSFFRGVATIEWVFDS